MVLKIGTEKWFRANDEKRFARSLSSTALSSISALIPPGILAINPCMAFLAFKFIQPSVATMSYKTPCTLLFVLLALIVASGTFACSDDAREPSGTPAENNDVGGEQDAVEQDSGVQDAAVQDTGETNGYTLVAVLKNPDKEAGETFSFSCELKDADGKEVDGKTTRHIEPLKHFEANENNMFKAIKTGPAKVHCTSEKYGLTSDPVLFTVGSARAHTSQAIIEPEQITAGDTISVRCNAQDQYGNDVSEKYAIKKISANPNAGVTIDGLAATFTLVETYEVRCQVSGNSEGEVAGTVKVGPNLPGKIEWDVQPYMRSYNVGESIQVRTRISDRFGNALDDIEVAFTHSANVERDGNTFHFRASGAASITATVVGASDPTLPMPFGGTWETVVQ